MSIIHVIGTSLISHPVKWTELRLPIHYGGLWFVPQQSSLPQVPIKLGQLCQYYRLMSIKMRWVEWKSSVARCWATTRWKIHCSLFSSLKFLGNDITMTLVQAEIIKRSRIDALPFVVSLLPSNLHPLLVVV